MTSRERLIKVLRGEIPDCVPVAPDTSNMIPAKLTGKPFWDLYLYQEIPIWKAYIDCVKHFGFDSLMDGYIDVRFDELGEIDREWQEVIVYRNDDRIVTQKYRTVNKQKQWEDTVAVYYKDNPPTGRVKPHDIGLPEIPDRYEPIEGRKEWPQGEQLLKLAKEELGDHGLVGVFCGTSCVLRNEADILDFYDNPEKYYQKRDEMLEYFTKRFYKLMSLEVMPYHLNICIILIYYHTSF